jgi:O-antigen/teichoic acid export membrane protein
MRLQFAKNAVANLARGSAGAVVALVLPSILVRHMPAATYAVWVLVLQSAAYVSLFNFGLQTAIGRYVAFANERRDEAQRDSVFSTALAGLCLGAAIALLLLAAAAAGAQHIFPGVPASLVPAMQVALLIVGLSMATDLPASACNGVFIGMQRYDLPAITVGGARILSAVGLVLAALSGFSLIAMALIVAGANLLAQLAQLLLMRRLTPGLRFRAALVLGSTARELFGYCLGLSVMSLGMLLVSGLDLVLVGRFDFARVIPYSVSSTLVVLISGVLYSGVNVLMPHGAVLHARGDARELGRLTVRSTQMSTLLLVLTGLPVLLFARPILHAWIGARYVEDGVPLISALIVANIIRLIGAPYSVLLIAAGRQSYIKISPLSEGVVNFIASVLLGLRFGAIGVALGTLLGSFVSIGTHLFYSMPRTREAIAFSRREFILSGALLPLAVTAPLWMAAAASCFGHPPHGGVALTAIALSLAGAAWLLRRSATVPRATLLQLRAGYTETDAKLRDPVELERLEGLD